MPLQFGLVDFVEPLPRGEPVRPSVHPGHQQVHGVTATWPGLVGRASGSGSELLPQGRLS